jgi:Raf kinase inhibitor-like YbhB/YbcL family protein
MMVDKNVDLIHWILWDVPASTLSLSANLPRTAELAMPAGAQQISFQGNGYAGPCPGATEHTYEFTLYALDALPLPVINPETATMPSVLRDHQLGQALLTGRAKTR